MCCLPLMLSRQSKRPVGTDKPAVRECPVVALRLEQLQSRKVRVLPDLGELYSNNRPDK